MVGESDGSFHDKDASVATILWKGKQVIQCEIYHEVPCGSPVEAEIKAMFLQLKSGVSLGYLQPCTDNYDVYRVMKGELQGIEGLAVLCQLLRGMRAQYKGLMPRWVPREELSFVDGLMREGKLKISAEGRNNIFATYALIRKWSRELSGEPIFDLRGKQPSVRPPKGKLPVFQNKYYMEVEEEGKVDAVFHICYALKPVRVHIVTKNFKAQLPPKILDFFW
ncbi:hypothetical protein BS78_01G494600 [Paspalum vaginatum]|nr:hypothetical protein BS78_01G494600 [Paspalum vaginatum]